MASPSVVAFPALSTSVPAQIQQLITSAGYEDSIVLVLLLLFSAAYISKGVLWDKPSPYQYKLFERVQAGIDGSLSGSSQTRNIAERLQDKQAVIFWGSQSGTAEGFAHRLARDLRRRMKLEVFVADISDYDEHTLSAIPASKPAILIMSTYGEGDPSDNSGSFLRWLKSKPETALQNLNFAAFGCGNSNYKYYNAVVETVARSLQDLGASMFLPIGRADEAKGTTEEDFLEWKSILFGQLCSQFGLTESEPDYEPSISVTFNDSIDARKVFAGQPFTRVGKKSLLTQVIAIPVIAPRELITSDPGGHSCLHLELDLSEHPEIKYKTGDHLAVQAVNPTSEVSSLLETLALRGMAHVPLVIQAIDSSAEKTRLPSPTTIGALLQHYLDICAPVSRETVLSLAHFSSSSAAKAYLLSLASNKDVYAEFTARHHITMARLLQHVKDVDNSVSWTELPLSLVIESLRPMIPRYYSISSSSIISPRRAAITVANNPSIGPNNISIPGLASTYLSSFVTAKDEFVYPPIVSSSLRENDSQLKPYLHASIRRSTFKLPASPSVPLILIAAGTGITPFRAFLHERAYLASINSQSNSIGRIILFFGCRHPDLDFLYKDELLDLQNTSLKGRLEIVCAFSRLAGQKKMYVQDRVEERKDEIVRLLLEDAALYICGSATMAREVGRRLTEAIGAKQALDEDSLKRWREERKRAKRWQEDVWG